VTPRVQIPVLTSLDRVIATERATLRPLAEADVDALWPIVSQPEFPKWMSWTAHAHRDETVAFVRAMIAAAERGTDHVWKIEHAGALVGTIGLHAIKWQVAAWRHDHAELGYWIAPAAQGRGLATEATRAVIEFAFATLGLHKLAVSCLVENTASKRVIEKAGFRFLATAVDETWRDGRWSSHLRYELTTTEWADVATTLRLSRPRRP
jgi:RimJ/RimL family protein N-acetyltransferase